MEPVHADLSETRPWLDSYAEGVPHEIETPTRPLTAMIAESVARFPRRPALEFFGAVTTYRDLGEQIDRAAEGLRRLGVTKGDRVAIVLPNCPQHVVAFYAALRLGAVVIEHNPLYTPRELRHQFEDHGARVAIVWDKSYDTIAGFPSDLHVDHIVSVDITRGMPLRTRAALRLPLPQTRAARAKLTAKPGAKHPLTWEKLVDHRRIPSRIPGPTVDDIALLQYTSGTTGTPKGAILTHSSLRANAAQGVAWVPGLVPGEETFYGVLPLFHAYGLTLCLTTAMSLGAKLVLFPTFDVGLVATAAKKSPPTFLPAVPPIYDRLADASAKGEIDLSTIRYAISGAMSLPAETIRRWEEVTGGLIVEGYGMTETSPISVGNPFGKARRAGTVGVPFPSTEIRIVDPDDTSVDRPVGEPGELLVRGPQVFQGYWRKPIETADVLLPDGWLRTGDIATMSPDGFVTIVDRIKELIITGGFNVSPSEVEMALETHPDVVAASAVGLPSSRGGEEVVAAVVLREGAVLDVDALRDHCRSRLAAYKVPRRIVELDDLPRSLVGKVLRSKVRDELLAL